MSRPYDHNELTGGDWVIDKRRRILVWVPTHGIVEPKRRASFDPDQIACHCGTTVSETCRTKNGNATRDHSGRTLARRCFCGGRVSARRSLCADCSRANELETKRAYNERLKSAA